MLCRRYRTAAQKNENTVQVGEQKAGGERIKNGGGAKEEWMNIVGVYNTQEYTEMVILQSLGLFCARAPAGGRSLGISTVIDQDLQKIHRTRPMQQPFQPFDHWGA